MKFKFFGLLMTLILCFSACTNELLNDKAVEGIALRKGSSTVVWNGDADKAVAQNIDEVKNDTRKNASGAKITSNAHSADFPGIYFIWDSKQKDNGYLKVSADVFDAYESFVLTAKESNTYWDFTIALQAGQQKTDDNCYVFYIPKVYNNKNINMVFLSEWKGIEVVVTNEPPTILDEPVIKGKLSFKKIVQDSEGVAQEWSDWDAFEFELLDGDETIANAKAVDGVVTFESDKIIPGKSYTVKEIISGSEELFEVVSEEFTANQVVTINSSSRPSSAAIVDPDDIWEILSGYKIKAFWQNEIKNQDDLAAMMAITVDGVAPTWIWDIENPWAYGVTGSESIIYINNINIDGEIVGDEVPFYFAADNAAVLFVNGQVAGYTEKSFAATGTTPGDDFTFTGFSDKDFGDLIEHWSWVYVKDIKPFLKQGNNVIKIA
ncbi:MAG: hypothetical protein LBE56_05485, partial [Tannerella sp.]|nr:hypothetical protein [Tannerella sp.]